MLFVENISIIKKFRRCRLTTLLNDLWKSSWGWLYRGTVSYQHFYHRNFWDICCFVSESRSESNILIISTFGILVVLYPKVLIWSRKFPSFDNKIFCGRRFSIFYSCGLLFNLWSKLQLALTDFWFEFTRNNIRVQMRNRGSFFRRWPASHWQTLGTDKVQIHSDKLAPDYRFSFISRSSFMKSDTGAMR